MSKAKFLGWEYLSNPETEALELHASIQSLIPKAEIDEMAYDPGSSTSPTCAHCRAIVRTMLDELGSSEPPA